MAKQIIVNAQKSSSRIALVEDGQIAEFHLETPEHERTIGNVYLGKIKKVMPNIRAAFVDIGQKQDAFLHFSDLTDNLPQQLAFLGEENPELGRFRLQTDVRLARRKRKRAPRPRRSGVAVAGAEARRQAVVRLLDSRHLPKHAPARTKRPVAERAPAPKLPRYNRLEDYLRQGDCVLAKIIKEPISAKGSRASTDISLAGRFLVLVPLADYVAVSKKISSFRERRRLRALLRSLVPDGFGVIVRTQAEGKSARILDTDLRLLVEKWRGIEDGLKGRPRPPKLLYEDVNMVSSVVRDLFSDDFDRILVDDPRLHRSLKAYVGAVAPHLAESVKLHKGPRPIFEEVGIEADLRAAFDTRVPMPSGAYLFIERTEAMHVVDVNSGRAGRGLSQEENALRVNLEAARTIARQLRLRDLGGIICVDFIDLRDDKNRRKVTDELKKAFKADRAVTKLLPMSDFGVVQITRQRLRPSFTHVTPAPEAPAPMPAAPPPATAVVPAPTEAEPNPPVPPHVAPAPVAPSPATEAAIERENGDRRRRGGRDRDRRRDDPAAFVAKMEAWLREYRTEGRRSPLVLRVHPFTAAYLLHGFPTYPMRWQLRYRNRLRLESDPTVGPFSFRFHDARTGAELTAPPSGRAADAAEAPAETPVAETAA